MARTIFPDINEPEFLIKTALIFFIAWVIMNFEIYIWKKTKLRGFGYSRYKSNPVQYHLLTDLLLGISVCLILLRIIQPWLIYSFNK